MYLSGIVVTLVASDFLIRTVRFTISVISDYYARKADFKIDKLVNDKIMEVDYFQLESPEFKDLVSRAKKGMNEYSSGIYSIIYNLQSIIQYVVTISGVIGIVIYSKEYIAEDDFENVMRRGKANIGDVLFTTEAPCGHVAQVDSSNIALAQRVIKYSSKDISKLDNSYLKYALLSRQFQSKLIETSTGATVKGIKGSKLHKLTIPVPEIETQLKIVSILDRFDKMINDITVGIPAEIDLRRSQYEYYKNKLLSFEEVKNE